MRLFIFGPLYLVWIVCNFLFLTIPSFLSIYVGTRLYLLSGMEETDAEKRMMERLNDEHDDGLFKPRDN